MFLTKAQLGLVFLLCWLHLAKLGFVPHGAKGLLAALGDFNNDKYVDVAVIDNKGDSGVFNTVSMFFHKGKQATGSSKLKKSSGSLKVNNLGSSEIISGVIPGDFNGDNALDVLVLIGNTYNDKIKFGTFYHQTGGEGKKFDSFALSDIEFDGLPLVCDKDGDQIPDLIGMVDGSGVIVNAGKNEKSFSSKNFTGKHDEKLGSLLPNFGHAFADVVDNHQPDMIFGIEDEQTPKLSIWSGDHGDYTHKIDIDFPETGFVGNPAVVDVDLDGDPEVVLPVCEDQECDESKIYYKEITDFQNTEEHWKLFHSFKGQADASNQDRKKFVIESAYKGVKNNAMLHVGDVDFDGYPDFLMTLRVGDDDTSKLYLMYNRECGNNDQICDGKRGLSLNYLDEKNVAMATFFDYKENGANDVLFSTTEDGEYRLYSRDESHMGDKAFLKVMVVGGLCGPNGPNCRFGEHVNYGANLPGPTISYTTHAANGDKRQTCATQLSQATNFALQAPWVIFGLGNTPNFVEKLTIWLASMKELGKASIMNVIPNSQLLLIPNPPGNPDLWEFRLLLTPSDIIWKFAIALFSTVIFLAIIVLILQYQEKREDDAEKRQEAHKFHFDAM